VAIRAADAMAAARDDHYFFFQSIDHITLLV
jgi:hypothetical protein